MIDKYLRVNEDNLGFYVSVLDNQSEALENRTKVSWTYETRPENNLTIYVDTRPLSTETIEKLIDTARRERPEIVSWLEDKKLNMGLMGRF
jgi:hypothetical protein